MKERGYEIVSQNEFEDIYRLSYGVLLKVLKYSVEHYGFWELKRFKDDKKAKKIKNIKDAYVITEDFSYLGYGGEEVSVNKGAKYFKGDSVKMVDSIRYTYEIKTTGSEFSGRIGDMNNYILDIQEILDKYK